MLTGIARSVGTDLAREAAARQVRRPAPIMVRWSSTSRPAAGPDAVFGTEGRSGWERMPLTGNVATIAEQFLALPRRQLVVLGTPGAGKPNLEI